MTSLPISLGDGYSPLVKTGDPVTPGTILAKRESNQEILIDIPLVFRIAKKHTGRTLRKNPGDSIKKGEILAVRKRLFGMKEDVIISSVDGTVLRYERGSGKVVLLASQSSSAENSQNGEDDDTVVSPIDGVVEVCDNDKILLSTDKDVLVGSRGIGGSITGEIFVVPDTITENSPVKLHQLGSEIIGKIILGGFFERDVLIKAIGMGAAGIVGSDVSEEDLQYVKERHFIRPIIMLGGADALNLSSWHGKKVYLQGEQKTILLLHI